MLIVNVQILVMTCTVTAGQHLQPSCIHDFERHPYFQTLCRGTAIRHKANSNHRAMVIICFRLIPPFLCRFVTVSTLAIKFWKLSREIREFNAYLNKLSDDA